jgi:CrcB protein
MTVQTIVGISLAGLVGTLARFGVSMSLQRWLGANFAWGTLGVNLLGCLILGWLAQAALNTELSPRSWHLVAAVGFCGAFTTFSTFGLETLRFLQDGAWGLAVLNIAGNVLLGLLMVWVGFIVGRSFIPWG